MKPITETFIITQLMPIENRIGKHNEPYVRRFIKMRHEGKDDTHPSHDVLFSRGAVKHTLNLKEGEKVQMVFRVDVSESKAGIPHTHLVPLKITSIK
jgi:hypothetical protein